MKVMILGATGATGRLVVNALLQQGHTVIAQVRNTETLNALYPGHEDRLIQLKGTVLSLGDGELSKVIHSVDGIICCLGHNLTMKGMYGAPHMLVTDSLQRLISLTDHNRSQPLKLVLMNSSGVVNHSQNETVPFTQRMVLNLLRVLVPPHLDNERAALYLMQTCTDLPHIEWVTVRPDSLIDSDAVSDYECHPSPIRSAIFNAGKVSRINVANFMGQLMCEPVLWDQWKGKTPVMYNQSSMT